MFPTRPMWYGVDGQPIDIHEANQLLGDIDALRVLLTIITTDKGQCQVSTVFLVLNNAFLGGPPVLWETMTLGGPDDMYQRRYVSLAGAVEGHHEAVTECLTAIDLDGATLVSVQMLSGRANVSGTSEATPVSRHAGAVTHPRGDNAGAPQDDGSTVGDEGRSEA